MAEAPTGRVFLQVAQGTVLRPQAQGKLDGGGEAGTGIQYRSLAGSRILLPTHCSREVLYGSEAPSGERQSWELNPKSPCFLCGTHACNSRSPSRFICRPGTAPHERPSSPGTVPAYTRGSIYLAE